MLFPFCDRVSIDIESLNLNPFPDSGAHPFYVSTGSAANRRPQLALVFLCRHRTYYSVLFKLTLQAAQSSGSFTAPFSFENTCQARPFSFPLLSSRTIPRLNLVRLLFLFRRPAEASHTPEISVRRSAHLALFDARVSALRLSSPFSRWVTCEIR